MPPAAHDVPRRYLIVDSDPLVDFPVDLHPTLRPIWDLLQNGVNTAVSLIKADGRVHTYRLPREGDPEP